MITFNTHNNEDDCQPSRMPCATVKYTAIQPTYTTKYYHTCYNIFRIYDSKEIRRRKGKYNHSHVTWKGGIILKFNLKKGNKMKVH